MEQRVRLIAPSAQRNADQGDGAETAAVPSEKTVISLSGPDGQPVSIKSISSLYVDLDASRWTHGGPIEIQGRLADESILINRKHPVLAKPGLKMEITAMADDGARVVGTGVYFNDASNRLEFQASAPSGVGRTGPIPVPPAAPPPRRIRIVNTHQSEFPEQEAVPSCQENHLGSQFRE